MATALDHFPQHTTAVSSAFSTTHYSSELSNFSKARAVAILHSQKGSMLTLEHFYEGTAHARSYKALMRNSQKSALWAIQIVNLAVR